MIYVRTIIGERSEPLSRAFNDQPRDILEKWFPLQSERAHSLNFFVVRMYVNRKEEE